MLGHLHRIEGAVIHGEKRGRELGYPTANMSVAGLHLPRLGVYAVKVDVLTGPQKGSYGGAASLGVRPMFGENTPNLETFLFDFTGDLYGHHLSVALVDYLRPELKFDGLPALMTQMAADCDRARAIQVIAVQLVEVGTQHREVEAMLFQNGSKVARSTIIDVGQNQDVGHDYSPLSACKGKARAETRTLPRLTNLFFRAG